MSAGSYKAYKVVTTNNFGEVETRWTAAAACIVLAKRLFARPAAHPQGAGELEAVVLSQVPPAKWARAPWGPLVGSRSR